MKAIVDIDACIGCQLCVGICPEVFEMREEKAAAILDPVPEDLISKCKEAADSCPVNAIIVK